MFQILVLSLFTILGRRALSLQHEYHYIYIIIAKDDARMFIVVKTAAV